MPGVSVLGIGRPARGGRYADTIRRRADAAWTKNDDQNRPHRRAFRTHGESGNSAGHRMAALAAWGRRGGAVMAARGAVSRERAPPTCNHTNRTDARLRFRDYRGAR